MGIGFVVIVPPAAVEAAARLLRDAGERVFRLGEIVAGERGVELVA
jgi:phosphoribosylaminoimidazole (AIR) synthetase